MSSSVQIIGPWRYCWVYVSNSLKDSEREFTTRSADGWDVVTVIAQSNGFLKVLLRQLIIA